MADADLDSGCLLNKKIRNAQLAQYNFILGEIMLFVQPNHCFAALRVRSNHIKPSFSYTMKMLFDQGGHIFQNHH